MNLLVAWITICYLLIGVKSWDNDELEIFDLVEEINTNFYNLLGVDQDADATAIRKAFRRLSLVLHPDKNDAPDAHIKFRQLAAVYDILRDNKKRLLYNSVLQNGLPDWRHAVYYYRRVRKMGLAEMAGILFVIITIGQYIVAWAAYAEKKYTAEQFINMKLKRLQKKQKKAKYDGPPIPETIILDIPTPSIWNTLPFQLPKFIWFCVMMCPHSVSMFYGYLTEMKRVKEEESTEEEEEELEVEVRGPRRRKTKFIPPESSHLEDEVKDMASNAEDEEVTETKEFPVSGGLWTDDDLVELIKLIKKYPQGTPSRWEKIASAMNRCVSEVTHMAHKVKEDGYRIQKQEEEPQGEEKVAKVKTKGGKLGTKNMDNGQNEKCKSQPWSQLQQKALEAALVKFPKSATHDRWEKIANCVPGKNKDDCILRYKQIVDMVKKKKMDNGPTNSSASDIISDNKVDSMIVT